MAKLKGKTAIITGATGGIGEATARLFVDEGANVMLVGRSKQKLEATRDRLDGDKNIAFAVADAADEEATSAAVDATVKAFGGVDVLFANAGTEGRVHPIEAINLE
ncbi:MAG: SDR family NAD(P)-dependent oxidoreductase, partial [Bryobacterales bacterium]|nr:SDR family NAD(P)-dependent oxidoreductase [Bryobacterales bacterium]